MLWGRRSSDRPRSVGGRAHTGCHERFGGTRRRGLDGPGPERVGDRDQLRGGAPAGVRGVGRGSFVAGRRGRRGRGGRGVGRADGAVAVGASARTRPGGAGLPGSSRSGRVRRGVLRDGRWGTVRRGWRARRSPPAGRGREGRSVRSNPCSDSTAGWVVTEVLSAARRRAELTLRRQRRAGCPVSAVMARSASRRNAAAASPAVWPYAMPWRAAR